MKKIVFFIVGYSLNISFNAADINFSFNPSFLFSSEIATPKISIVSSLQKVIKILASICSSP